MSTLLAVEAALLTVCRSYGGGLVFTAANSSRDDWQVIDSPSSDLGLVIEMGGESLEGDRVDGYGNHGAYQERHQLQLSVTLKVATGATGAAALAQQLKATTEGLKDYLRKQRTLGLPEVRDLIPVRTSALLERLPRRGEAPSHLVQRVTLYVYCESDL